MLVLSSADSSWVSPRLPSTLVRHTCSLSSTREKVSSSISRIKHDTDHQQRLLLASPFSTVPRFLLLVSLVLSPQVSLQVWMAWLALQDGDGKSITNQITALTNNPRLFIVEGAVTAVVAIVGFFMLPNTPLTTSWLSEREKQLAHERMEKDKVSDSQEGGSSWDGLKQACKDKRTWLFCLMQNFHLSACSFNSFFPT